jgi:tRNA 5-methylaminomethyl-2-thiouridine biosynthesis bifunctional protein
MAARGIGFPHAASGLVQLARDAGHEALQRELPGLMGYPDDYVRYLDAAALAGVVGHAVPIGGWLVPGGGWANPGGLCQACLDMAGPRVRAHYVREVAKLDQVGVVWRAIDANGQNIAEAPTVIIANGLGARTLSWSAPLPLQGVRGQVTQLPVGRIPGVALPVCREGYLTPAFSHRHCVGASYDLDDDVAPRAACDAGNLARLARLLDGLPEPADEASDMTSRVGFRTVPPDRLPLVGALPDFARVAESRATQLPQVPRVDGLHVLLGYASRGIIWSSLMAETLASSLEGEPLPIEADLADAVDPGRFPLRSLRKNKGPA